MAKDTMQSEGMGHMLLALWDMSKTIFLQSSSEVLWVSSSKFFGSPVFSELGNGTHQLGRVRAGKLSEGV